MMAGPDLAISMVVILVASMTGHGPLTVQSLSQPLRHLATKAVLRLEFTAAGMVTMRAEGRAMEEMGACQKGGNEVLWSQGCCYAAL